MQTVKSMVIRLFPTKEQEQKMWQHVHAARYIWNYMLQKQIDLKNEGKFRQSAYDMNEELTPMKKQEQFLWLKRVSNATLQHVNARLDQAFKRMKDGAGHPKFKARKKTRPSFPVRGGKGAIWFSDTQVKIESSERVNPRGQKGV